MPQPDKAVLEKHRTELIARFLDLYTELELIPILIAKKDVDDPCGGLNFGLYPGIASPKEHNHFYYRPGANPSPEKVIKRFLLWFKDQVEFTRERENIDSIFIRTGPELITNYDFAMEEPEYAVRARFSLINLFGRESTDAEQKQKQSKPE